ncbi:MAG: SDR family oxidoreductase [Chthoniobacterales bacterium]|nr:SDR family oxidoreductase [Chthoniobacterales bacterium]
MRLKDKVALVTGATSGIGKAIAERFAAEGAHVAVNYRAHGDNQQKAEQMLRGFPVAGMPAIADVSQRREVEKMIADIGRTFGRLDIVVNNAGLEINRPFLEITDDEWNLVIAVNLYGPFLVSQLAARLMVERGGDGKILNISSVHEDIPFPNYTPYCASKGGVRMMMRNLAVELAPHKINVNNIAPGAIATPINRKTLSDPKAKQEAISEIPWGRFGTPEEVASVAVFLASDDAEYVTGSTYYVDGGLTQQVTKY